MPCRTPLLNRFTLVRFLGLNNVFSPTLESNRGTIHPITYPMERVGNLAVAYLLFRSIGWTLDEIERALRSYGQKLHLSVSHGSRLTLSWTDQVRIGLK